ncbi:phosphoenolpyruvate carboxylase [Agriterribacter sp.]|uniref:phosphoenolpyruvate carboxylase n=1 Tax=Agriterribacter sp. TaxID=2821509 RepID=UPI002C91200A|nr:phosphoenolpyruvate carboxylase [Agriterribacter sp.]HTN08967.1 phosphoenolpyruvate carboxylase [Agriterribacter sp.]
MPSSSSQALTQFQNLVGRKFQIYNSLFTSLPFHRIEKTGILLSLLLSYCEEGYDNKQSPSQIIEDFFSKHTSYAKEEDKLDLLFRFVQYVERQVVLFDALEDAAFTTVNDMNGPGTLKGLQSEVAQFDNESQLKKKLEDFSIRLVLTAHPTQFYPGAVLGIIHDLTRAIAENNINQINMYLQQLGKTPFLKEQKPTPYDEAISLMWYLENIFYQAAGRIISFMKTNLPEVVSADNAIMRMGFWPGGDRDGNPYVRTDTTLKVAGALRESIMRSYYLDVRRLKRRLTFKGVDVPLQQLELKLYNNLFVPGYKSDINKTEILNTLLQIKETLIYKHNGLFLDLIESLINKVEVFGLYFASLDVRQDSSVHTRVIEEIVKKTKALPAGYLSLPDNEKIQALLNVHTIVNSEDLTDEIHRDTLEVMAAIKDIQANNGVAGCDRYVISHADSALTVIEVYGLLLMSGWQAASLLVDIVPLFETVDDLDNAAGIMKELYELPAYREHLRLRKNKQTIMLGFSDGTKDGGYLMANWSIYKAKEALTLVSRAYDIDVIFFDGRGGPPARGGGKTHKFYASLGKNIANEEIQLTIQGQTVSSNFGTIESAQFNIEQLINAGISNDLFASQKVILQDTEKELIQQLAEKSLTAYLELKNHPNFLEYLGHASPLRFYAATNIGSRPAKRGGSGKLVLEDLRAIPFVGSWSQLKQNVTGYYGVGTAFKKMDEEGRWEELKKLYDKSTFIKTLIANCEMSMKKSFFPMTRFLSNHPVYGEIWNKIFDEYELTKQYIFRLTGKDELMADYPVEQLSVQMRERIVLPLVTIQQYAITKVREMEESGSESPHKQTLEKLVMRCSFGIINAGRNSA